MDALKAKLQPLIKNGFWVSAAVIFIGAIAVWVMSWMRLSSEHADRVAKLDSEVSSVSNVRNQLSVHPNDDSHEQMQTLIDARTAEVLQAWQSVYERQQNILTWPQNLEDDFLMEFENKIPVERYIEYPIPVEQQVTTDLRQRYRNYIKEILPSVAALAGAKWTADFDAVSSGDGYGEGGGGGGSYGSSVIDSITGTVEEPIVEWPSSSQEQTLSDLFPWRGTRPTTLQVHYSQENLWILKQLCQLVGDMNGDAKQAFQAKIRSIAKIAIGESVDFEAGDISDPGDDSTAMGMAGDYGYDDMEEGYGGGDYGDSYGSSSYGSSTSTTEVAPDPAENRYVDLQNQPLPASRLRSALVSEDPADAGLAVAKRVPVQMSVVMDQRYIPNLLAMCGSIPLMVEVKQVRVLPEDAGAAAASAGGGYGSDSGEEMDEGYGESSDEGYGYGEDGGYGSSGPSLANIPEVEVDETPFDVTVEIYGIIHIYNPPNKDALGLNKVTDEEVVIDGSDQETETPVTPPADTPEQPGTPDQPAAQTPAGTDPDEDAAGGDTPDSSTPDGDAPAAPAADDNTAPPAAPPTAILSN
ncbi:hypothetical protein [Crateriforma spongiae]|uniref:hypothetical protein n=1 Tax=Crateriforma spongiae TaxID=2724528 RepID=UPI0014453E93|nr:hypothetical protein [Crateriforma spongiae]